MVAITGGARGIGRATAAALVGEGARVAIGDLDLARAKATAVELDGAVLALELDVTDRASFERFLEEVERQLGPLDVLVNNAGIMPVGPFLDEDDASTARQIDINLNGVILGMKLALARMLPRRSGQIVNLASMAGKVGFPGIATYSATKHAVAGLSEAVRAEVIDQGIEIAIVMPGVVNTELGAGLVEARGVRNSEPGDVATAIVEALRSGRVDVFVPPRLAGLAALSAVLPRNLLDWLNRLFKTDQIAWRADRDKRADYEQRAARSAPRGR